MNRIDRLAAILVLLQSKKVIKGQEIADRFGLSLRTVYRDIRALEEAGVPLISEAGKGYSILPGYYLPPLMFTDEEASSLLLASRFLLAKGDASTSTSIQSAMEKIRTVLRTSEKEYLEQLDAQVMVDAIPEQFSKRFLERIRTALRDQRVLHLRYHATYEIEKTSERDIEPIGLFFYGQHWHLLAYCQLRADYRDFRLDRIQRLWPTSKTFSKKQHPAINELIRNRLKEAELDPYVIRFKREVAKFLENQKFHYGFVAEKESTNYIEMTFLYEHPEYFGRWLLMYGDAVEIINPKSLKAKMVELAHEIQKTYL